ncbi:chorismate synthase [Anoxybacterium hadale]|uniref:Chorismate synthase n=1 Tax=Anoxybacterium hadale TaxID=3408580 RepID=A0ACD1A885_9FIRM|nr:chorismate synthase [Clostridiales bacterium]
MGSTWGNHIKISIFGESHGNGIGVVMDGFPAGHCCDMEFIRSELARRAPGQSSLTTGRREGDQPEILSGMLTDPASGELTTTGAPICIVIRNTDTRSGDYENLRTVPRPSHSDFTGQLRYQGYNDIRGGGHFSGRLTAPMVFAGALCKDYLRKKYEIEIGSHIYQIGEVKDSTFDLTSISDTQLKELQKAAFPVLDPESEGKMKEIVDHARRELDSVGGVIECAATGVAAGIGSPMFSNVESRIASILYGVPAVKGVEFGLGFEMAEKRGSEVNDCYVKNGNNIETRTNYNGGIAGGITTGMPIVVRAAIKPTPSISRGQTTLNLKTGQEELLEIHGRHDPCIAMRAPVVIESAVALAMLDLCLEAWGYAPV